MPRDFVDSDTSVPTYLAEHGHADRSNPNEICQNVHPLCISAAPARLDRYPRGFTGHVARPGPSIETRSLPSSLAPTHRGFALITRTAPCLRQLP